jgi:hypothetical protein
MSVITGTKLKKLRTKGIITQEKASDGYKFTIDSKELEISNFLNYLSTKADIKDLEIDNETLDNIIINLYQKI